MGVKTPLVSASPHTSYAATATTSNIAASKTTSSTASSHSSSSTDVMKVAAEPSSPSLVVRKNPFQYTTPIDTYERIKIVVMCLLGVPLLRIVIIAVGLVVVVLVSNVAMLGFERINPQTQTKRALPRWRQWLASPIPYLARAGLFVCGYYWIPVTAPPGFDRHRRGLARIVVSNHVSFIDGLFLLSYLAPSIAMKAEVADIPLIGKVVQTTQPILIDRATAVGRKHALQEIAAHIGTPDAPPLLIFPEGTTSNQDYLTKFKVGSFTAGVACQPVVLRYPFKHFDVSWSPGVSGLYLAVRLLCQVYNRLDVQFLPVYTPSEREVAEPEVYAENVRQEMARALGVACTNHAFEDVALLLQVGKYAHEHVVPITDVGEVMSLTDLRGADIDRLVRYFVKHDLNQDGQISLAEMTQLFPADDAKLLARLFALVDANGNGQIDFRELCMGLRALTARHDSADELLRFAFGLYDVDNNGVIDASELESMLRFNQTFYGAAAQSVDAILVDHGASDSREITFEHFAALMARQPDLLAHARSKLETLRGSLRE